jgi:hypothetical protein
LTAVGENATGHGPSEPNVNSVECPRAPALVEVLIVADGFRVRVDKKDVARGCGAMGDGPAIAGADTVSLVACLSKISHKDWSNDLQAVTIAALPTTRFDELVAVLSAVRTEQDGARLFGDVTLAAPLGGD